MISPGQFFVKCSLSPRGTGISREGMIFFDLKHTIMFFLSRIKRNTGIMEVIYYMRNYYPLTAAQKMHHNWIMDYGTQQVSGVSVVASVQAELDFGLLKKCIQMEMERSDCTRVRFTKPDKDGNVKQYIEKQDPRDIELKDLSGMESLAKADELMQQWAYETFDGDNIPMCEFTMLKLPEGYNGFFLHMDHRLIDSCGLVVMIGDLFQLYTHYKYGTACPQELVDFETVLKKDLAKSGNEKRLQKIKNSGMTSWMNWASRYILIFRDHLYWRKQESVMGIRSFVLLILR